MFLVARLSLRQHAFSEPALCSLVASLKRKNSAIFRRRAVDLAQSAPTRKPLSEGRLSLRLFTSAIWYPLEFFSWYQRVA
jgi:hypothetical protein